MRYIRYAVLLILALTLLIIAFANREPVTLRLMPDEIGRYWSWGRVVELPLFLVIFGAIIAGVAIGFVWEWLRESRFRSEAGRSRRESASLKREVVRLKGGEAESTDEVVRLLDSAAGR